MPELAPPDRFPLVLIALMKGVTYQESDPALWQGLLELQTRVREHVAFLGLDLVIDEAEGYGYLHQRGPREGEPELPRLVARRPLTFPVSLLLALLRKKLVELDAGAGGTRLIVGREEVVELLRVFLPDTANDARLLDRVDAHLNKVIELGFVRRLAGDEQRFEVRRILKAFVDAQWLSDLEGRLADYQASLATAEAEL